MKFIQLGLKYLVVIAALLLTLVIVLFAWREIDGFVNCNKQSELYSETGVAALCFAKIKKNVEHGNLDYFVAYADILIGDGKYQEATPVVKKCVLARKECINFALMLCQKKISGFDSSFIEYGFSIADRKSEKIAKLIDGYESSYRSGLYAPCLPR